MKHFMFGIYSTMCCGIAFAVVACNSKADILEGGPRSIVDDAGVGEDKNEEPPAVSEFALESLSAELTQNYLALIAPPLVGRVLTEDERNEIEAGEGRALRPIIERWATEPGLAEAARRLIQNQLSVSGSRDGINFELPGNAASQTVLRDLPWSNVLTSSYCYDEQGRETVCDTGAPYGAGVLATRAYMASRASRFNLTRASTLMKAFACLTYPIDPSVQPRIDRTKLLPMFRADRPEEQTDPRAAGAFGNGFACYDCHSQFSVHAQLFVKFDSHGQWIASATGLQDPNGELGRSTGELMTSHLNDPLQSSDEHSQMLGTQVANLAEAASVLSKSPQFLECSIRNILELVLDFDRSVSVDTRLLQSISNRATRRETDPTFKVLMIEALSHPRVIYTMLENLGVAPIVE